MRKFLMMSAAGLALALAAPLTASAAPVLQGGLIQAALDAIDNTAATAWHCRRWSGWCGRRGWHRRWHSRRRW